MAESPAFPAVTDGRVHDGWRLVEETVEQLFELPALTVRGAIRRYEDAETAAAVAGVTDGTFDRAVRFLAATRLVFDPDLPPGTVPSVILPAVRREVRSTFQARLEDRGLEAVERSRTERTRVDGNRAYLTGYRARYPLGNADLPVTGWAGVWHDGEAFFVVTGGYPARRLADVLGLDEAPEPLTRSPASYRNEFFDLLDSVR